MFVNYNNFAKTFAKSRSQLKWPEISYFLSNISDNDAIIDVACGSGRLIEAYYEYFHNFPKKYIGIDASEKLLQEARSYHPGFDFFLGNMENSESYQCIPESFNNIKKSIFCIAGFHHILNIQDRILTLKSWYDVLNVGERVYMTNWALESPVNINSYKNALIQNSENEFGGHDFSIKIGKYYRWYHSFSLTELEYLANETQFTIIENRLYSTEKNYITILEK